MPLPIFLAVNRWLSRATKKVMAINQLPRKNSPKKVQSYLSWQSVFYINSSPGDDLFSDIYIYIYIYMYTVTVVFQREI